MYSWNRRRIQCQLLILKRKCKGSDWIVKGIHKGTRGREIYVSELRCNWSNLSLLKQHLFVHGVPTQQRVNGYQKGRERGCKGTYQLTTRTTASNHQQWNSKSLLRFSFNIATLPQILSDSLFLSISLNFDRSCCMQCFSSFFQPFLTKLFLSFVHGPWLPPSARPYLSRHVETLLMLISFNIYTSSFCLSKAEFSPNSNTVCMQHYLLLIGKRKLLGRHPPNMTGNVSEWPGALQAWSLSFGHNRIGDY